MKQRTLISFSFIILLLLPCSAQPADWSWRIMLQPGTNLYGVWGSSGTDVFVVGNSGAILHYDGTSWSTMASGTTIQLNGVWGGSGTDVFAVGNSGTILHYDGSSWTAMTSGTTQALYGVWGSSGTDVFAVGNSGTILHYDGLSWSAMASGTTNFVYGIWGSSGSDVFAVGGAYSGFFISRTILHYNGSSWSGGSTPFKGLLNSVWGTSGNDVFAVGDGYGIAHYNGSIWSDMTGPAMGDLNGIWGSSGSDVFAVGGDGIILRYNGSTWPSMASGTTKQLNGIWGSSISDIFAVGNGIILYYGEQFFTTTSTTTTTTTTAVPTTTTSVPPVKTTTTAASTSTTTSVSPNAPCAVCTDPANLVTPFAGGNGSIDDPYVICTADQLNNVRTQLDKTFVLRADIDLSGYANWEPIGSPDFTGVFDGNHFTISNLTINRSGDQYTGLFGNVGYPSGIVKNIRLQNAQVTGGSEVGALAGSCNSMIIGCSSSGRVVGLGDYSNAGGLAGSVLGNYLAFSISQSYSTCEVIGDQKAGGLVGLVGGGDALITDCYATGAVSGNTLYSSGGLIASAVTGAFGMSATVKNCYSIGRVGNASYAGGLIGNAGTTGFTLINSYWDTQTSGMTTSKGGEGKTTAQMKQQATYSGWDFATLWGIDEGISYPGLLLTEQPASCTPTLIELTDFAAQPFNRKVIITWQTESEIGNAGFNIFRSESENGKYVKINGSLISAEGSSTQGASYEFSDRDVKNRRTYWYKLEDIDLNGVSTFHEPVSATPRLMVGFFKTNK